MYRLNTTHVDADAHALIKIKGVFFRLESK